MQEKVGFFGGSFDPVHLGHIALCVALKEKAKLDRVLVCPAIASPGKEEKYVADPKSRLEMARLAFEDIPGVEVIDLEIKENLSGYTVDTLEILYKQEEGNTLYLMLGSDVAKDFPNWKNPDRIRQLVKPLVARRFLDTFSFKEEPYKSYFESSFLDMPIVEISSTEVRERLFKKQSCQELVPAKVLDYIYRHRLYFSS